MLEKERQEMRRTAKKHRSAPKIVNAASIPARDTDDAYGNPFLGLPGNRLQYRGLTKDEIGDREVDGRIIALDEIVAAHQTDNSTTARVLATNPHSNDPLSAANENDNGDRAVNGDAVRTKTLDGYHAKDNAFNARPIASNAHGIDPFGNQNENDNSLRAITGAHVRTKTMRAYHFPDNELGARVVKIGPGDLTSKVDNASLADNLNGFALIKDGTLPVRALASQPWEERTTPAAVRDIVRDMVKATSLKP